MKRILFAALAPTALLASEFKEVTISRYEINGEFVTLYLNNTVLDQQVSCAIYDADGQLIATDVGITDNLATAFMIITNQASETTSARCVVND